MSIKFKFVFAETQVRYAVTVVESAGHLASYFAHEMQSERLDLRVFGKVNF
jgi:hypothetical protein